MAHLNTVPFLAHLNSGPFWRAGRSRPPQRLRWCRTFPVRTRFSCRGPQKKKRQRCPGYRRCRGEAQRCRRSPVRRTGYWPCRWRAWVGERTVYPSPQHPPLDCSCRNHPHRNRPAGGRNFVGHPLGRKGHPDSSCRSCSGRSRCPLRPMTLDRSTRVAVWGPLCSYPQHHSTGKIKTNIILVLTAATTNSTSGQVILPRRWTISSRAQGITNKTGQSCIKLKMPLLYLSKWILS